jgi:hypothetical protein
LGILLETLSLQAFWAVKRGLPTTLSTVNVDIWKKRFKSDCLGDKVEKLLRASRAEAFGGEYCPSACYDRIFP